MEFRRRFLSTGFSALALSTGPKTYAGEGAWPIAASDSRGIDGGDATRRQGQ